MIETEEGVWTGRGVVVAVSTKPSTSRRNAWIKNWRDLEPSPHKAFPDNSLGCSCGQRPQSSQEPVKYDSSPVTSPLGTAQDRVSDS